MSDVEDVILRLDGVFLDPSVRRAVNRALRNVAEDAFDEVDVLTLHEHRNVLMEHADDTLLGIMIHAGVKEALLYAMFGGP